MSELLQNLMESYTLWCHEDMPEFATMSGSELHKDKLEKLSMDVALERYQKCTAYLQVLENIDSKELNYTDVLNKEILREDLRSFVTGYKWRHHAMCNAINYFEIIPNKFAILEKYVRADNPSDLLAYIRRMDEIPRYVNEQIQVLKVAMEQRTTLHERSIKLVIEKLHPHIAIDPRQSVFFKPFIRFQKSGSKEKDNQQFKELVEIQNRAISVIADKVLPALKRLEKFLLGEYVTFSRPKHGVLCLPNGSEYYRACLRWHLSIDCDPAELHELGLQEMARIRELMAHHIKAAGSAYTVEEYISYLKQQRDLYFKSEDEAMAEIRRIIDDVIMPRWREWMYPVSNLERLDLAVSTAGSGGGFYTPASKDGTIPGLFSVCRPVSLAKYTLMPLITHELAHHIQRVYNLARPPPSFRLERSVKYYTGPFYMPIYTAYIEGWACYAEYLGEEMGLYRDKLEWFARYSDDMLRAARIVIDTGINAFGWTAERGLKLLTSVTCDPEADMQNEIDRYICFPGHAVAYKFGEIKIRELRKLAEEKLQDKFSIRAFHDVVMSLGPAPIYTLERVVKDWIELGGPEPDHA